VAEAAIASDADWILLLAEKALLHPKALAWFAAAGERTAANAFVTDEETVSQNRGHIAIRHPSFGR
jgi:hypothetical protein